MASLTFVGTADICIQASFARGGLGVGVNVEAGTGTAEVISSVARPVVGCVGSGVLVA